MKAKGNMKILTLALILMPYGRGLASAGSHSNQKELFPAPHATLVSPNKDSWTSSAKGAPVEGLDLEGVSDEFSSNSSAYQMLSHSHQVQRNCLSHHIREALAVNRERLPRYSKLTGGRSEIVSKKLIDSEKLVLALSPVIDLPARFWQTRDIPVICMDLVPMAGAASFEEKISLPLTVFQRLSKDSLQALVTRVRQAINLTNREGLLQVHGEILRLKNQKDFHCMKRHILESLARSLYVLPSYEKQSAMLNLPSPKTLISLYLSSQVASLNLADEIDNLASEVQKEGVAILCNDLPPIPYGPLYDSQIH